LLLKKAACLVNEAKTLIKPWRSTAKKWRSSFYPSVLLHYVYEREPRPAHRMVTSGPQVMHPCKPRVQEPILWTPLRFSGNQFSPEGAYNLKGKA
jgi:hypothetical protein